MQFQQGSWIITIVTEHVELGIVRHLSEDAIPGIHHVVKGVLGEFVVVSSVTDSGRSPVSHSPLRGVESEDFHP